MKLALREVIKCNLVGQFQAIKNTNIPAPLEEQIANDRRKMIKNWRETLLLILQTVFEGMTGGPNRRSSTSTWLQWLMETMDRVDVTPDFNTVIRDAERAKHMELCLADRVYRSVLDLNESVTKLESKLSEVPISLTEDVEVAD